jgi:ubiquinone biosynthesis protein
MVVAEGVGRRLNPTLNMWQLARPLIEEWVIANLGPAARAREAAADLVHGLERLPRTLANLERATAALAEGGIRLHPDRLAALQDGRGRRGGRSVSWALWCIAALLAGLLVLSIVE